MAFWSSFIFTGFILSAFKKKPHRYFLAISLLFVLVLLFVSITLINPIELNYYCYNAFEVSSDSHPCENNSGQIGTITAVCVGISFIVFIALYMWIALTSAKRNIKDSHDDTTNENRTYKLDTYDVAVCKLVYYRIIYNKGSSRIVWTLDLIAFYAGITALGVVYKSYVLSPCLALVTLFFPFSSWILFACVLYFFTVASSPIVLLVLVQGIIQSRF